MARRKRCEMAWDVAEDCRDCKLPIEPGDWRFSPSDNPAYTGEHWVLCFDCTLLRAQEIDRRGAPS